jgi:hypothetical protein
VEGSYVHFSIQPAAVHKTVTEKEQVKVIQLVAFVFMPEHVHLLVFPLDQEPSIDGYLAAIKRPVSADVKRDLQREGSPLINRLTIRERPGKEVFAFGRRAPDTIETCRNQKRC